MVTRGAAHTGGGDGADVAGAAVIGLGRVLAQEEPRLRVRVVDLDPSEGDEAAAMRQLVRHRPGMSSVSARRAGVVLAPRLEPIAGGGDRSSVRPSAWWITGGLGDIGLAIAEHVSGDGAPIVLTSRRAVPAREQWEDLAADGSDAELAALLRRLLALERRCGGLHVMPGDVSRREDVAALADRVHERFGRGYAVVHAAGAPGTGQRVRGLGADQFQHVFGAKVVGAGLLDELTREHGVVQFVVVSSLSALAGGWGLGDYAAANCALDALALARRARGLPTSIVNWAAWDNLGMAKNASVELTGALSAEAALRPWPLLISTVVPQLVIARPGLAVSGRVGDADPAEHGTAAVDRTDDADGADGDTNGGGGADAEERFWQLVVDAAGIDRGAVNPAASLADLGMDSRDQIAFLDLVESELEIDLPLEILADMAPLADLSRTVREQRRGRKG